MKKFASILLTLVMILSLTGSIFAAETYTIYLQGNSDIATFALTEEEPPTRTFDVYQIFTGNVFIGDDGKPVLSNVEWGANGIGTGAVAADVLDELSAVENASTADKLAKVEQYVDFSGTPKYDDKVVEENGY